MIITSLSLNKHVMIFREAFVLLIAILLFLGILTQLQYSLPWVRSLLFVLVWPTVFFLWSLKKKNCFVYGFGESEIRWRAKTIKLEMETTGIFLDVDVSMYTISLYTSFSKFNWSNSEAFEALEVAFASRKTVGSCCACQVMSYMYGVKMLRLFVSYHFSQG